MNKFECDACVNRKCIVCTKGPETPKYCTVVENMMASWKAVKEEMDKKVKEETVSCDDLQKLTVEIFNHPDCPEWAKYAAVDIDGVTCVYQDKPHIKGSEWVAQYHGINWCVIPGRSDASDWKNSLIERPKKVKLPDWCKVDSLGYDTSCKRYFNVIYIGSNDIDIAYLDNGDGATRCYRETKSWVETRKISFNKHELKKLIGRVVTTLEGDISMVTDYEEWGHKVCIYGELYDADELSHSAWLLDGKPCCHLEHLNEKGEWVE